MIAQEDKIKDYGREIIEEGESKLRHAIDQAEKRLKQGRERAVKWAGEVDKQAHENPWPVVATVGFGCLLLGVLLGKSKD